MSRRPPDDDDEPQDKVQSGRPQPRRAPAPSAASDTSKALETPLPRGIKDTVAVTVRLDQERYHRLVGFGARFAPRRTNQEILVAALDAYLENE